MSSGIRVLLTLSVLLSSTSLFLTACAASSLPVSNMAENSTMRTMAQLFVPGEALVKFKPSVSQERIDAILKESGTELITEIKGSGVHHVRIVGKGAVVKKFFTFQAVEYAEPNYLYQVSMIPNDPQFTSLWVLQKTDQSVSGTVGTRHDPLPPSHQHRAVSLPAPAQSPSFYHP